MTPEGKVKAEFKKRIKTYTPKVWGWLPVSNGYGIHGIPDWIGCADPGIQVDGSKGPHHIPAIFVAVEFKSSTGKCTAHQLLRHSEIRDAKGWVEVVTPDNIDEWFEELDRIVS